MIDSIRMTLTVWRARRDPYAFLAHILGYHTMSLYAIQQQQEKADGIHQG